MQQDANGSAPPPGWCEIRPDDPFNRQIGGLFVSEIFLGDAEEPARIGFRVRPENCNFHGTCHGGMLCSALDVALGYCAQKASGAAFSPTVSLTLDFMRAAKEGEWLESRVRVLRVTRNLAFCDGILTGADEAVARANGVFKLIFPPPD